MKCTIGKLTAGIGYGFLSGAAVGLITGVLLDRLFFWAIIGMAAGLVIGIAICCSRAASNCRMQKRFNQSDEVRDEGQADTLES